MNPFIKKQDYNYIKKCLFDLNNTLRNCNDKKIVEATKLYLNEKILNIFSDLSEEQKNLLDINGITDSLYINPYLSKLNDYVYGMPKITNAQLKKLFKKEKKLKFPDLEIQNTPKVYLGWIDYSIRKLLIAYNMNGKLIGMACRLPNTNSNNTNVCTLCNHIGPENEVAFVSPICKSNKSGEDYYRSIGFHICLDSNKCNERIVSIEKLEDLLKDVNNLK